MLARLARSFSPKNSPLPRRPARVPRAPPADLLAQPNFFARGRKTEERRNECGGGKKVDRMAVSGCNTPAEYVQKHGDFSYK